MKGGFTQRELDAMARSQGSSPGFVDPLPSEIGEPEAVRLTPTERLLAPMLAAWDAWRPDSLDEGDDAGAVLEELTDVLFCYGYAEDPETDDDFCPLSAKGRDLLARARKAGVL